MDIQYYNVQEPTLASKVNKTKSLHEHNNTYVK